MERYAEHEALWTHLRYVLQHLQRLGQTSAVAEMLAQLDSSQAAEANPPQLHALRLYLDPGFSGSGRISEAAPDTRAAAVAAVPWRYAAALNEQH
mgnify:CR=1 FL=1